MPCCVLYTKWIHAQYFPHGNSKSGNPYYATLPNTAAHIKGECERSGPKHTVASVSASKGGIVSASYPGELPRNEQQVSNFKRKKTSIEKTVANGDALYTVMFRHKWKIRETNLLEILSLIRTLPFWLQAIVN